MRTVTLATVAGLLATTGAHAAEPLDLVGPVSDYKLFVSEQTDLLVDETEAFVAAVKAGEVEKAKALFAPTRQHYEMIEPIAELFSDLDVAIDSRADDYEKAEADPAFTGFHRIEYGLWAQNSTDGLAPVAAGLAADAVELQTRIKALELTPPDLAANAADLARRVADQAAGGQVPYSQTDLAEFTTDLEGITKSAMLVDPLVAAANSATSAALHQAIEATQATLAGFAIDGAYPPFSEVDAGGRKAISASFETLSTAIAALNPAIGLE